MATKEYSMTNGIKAAGIRPGSAGLNNGEGGGGGDKRFLRRHWSFLNWRRYFSSHSNNSKRTKVGPKSEVKKDEAIHLNFLP